MPKENIFGSIDRKEYSRELSTYCDEFQRQIGTHLKLGFHKVLGLSLEEYLSSLPHFNPPPENFRGRFDKILLVEPRIPVWLRLQIAGYKYFISGEIHDESKDKNGLPFIAWIQDGSKKGLRDLPNPDERDATIQEGASLLIAYPKTVENHPIALLGSSVASTNENTQRKNSCIYQWSDGLVGIGADYVGYLEDDGAKPATCGIIKASTSI